MIFPWGFSEAKDEDKTFGRTTKEFKELSTSIVVACNDLDHEMIVRTLQSWFLGLENALMLMEMLFLANKKKFRKYDYVMSLNFCFA